MNRYEFHLRITADQYLEYYRGTVRQVMAHSTTGQNVQFPAALLQQFVTGDGISGHFALVCDENNRNPRLERLGYAENHSTDNGTGVLSYGLVHLPYVDLVTVLSKLLSRQNAS